MLELGQEFTHEKWKGRRTGYDAVPSVACICPGFPSRMAPTWHQDAIIGDLAIRKARRI